MAKLLRSAGLAIKALTEGPSVAPTSEAPTSEIPKTTSIAQQKQRFTAATTEYFALVSSVDIGLRQQIHALEEDKIIPSEATSKESQGGADISVNSTGASAATGIPSSTSRSAIIGGGLGNLDIGWLNSRNDNVDKEMDAELWNKASTFLAGLEESKTTGSENDEQDLMND